MSDYKKGITLKILRSLRGGSVSGNFSQAELSHYIGPLGSPGIQQKETSISKGWFMPPEQEPWGTTHTLKVLQYFYSYCHRLCLAAETRELKSSALDDLPNREMLYGWLLLEKHLMLVTEREPSYLNLGNWKAERLLYIRTSSACFFKREIGISEWWTNEPYSVC